MSSYKKYLGTALIGVLALAVACTEAGPQNTNGLPDDIEQDIDNKADSTEGIVHESVSETLWSNSLRRNICGKIGFRDSALDYCLDNFEFTVNGMLRSTRYAHLDDCRPITMGLDVEVLNPAEDQNWQVELRRKLGSNYVLYWQFTVSGSSMGDIHDYIDDIADEAGEYPDFWDSSEWQGRIRMVQMSAVPQEIQEVFERELENAREELCYYDEGECTEGAEYGDVLAEILKDGQVVGYLLGIEYYIDDSLFDGGGLWLYFDHQGVLVESMEWWG